MAIKKIHIENIKSFKKVDVELGDFNVLIGANASGKSNFVKVLELLYKIHFRDDRIDPPTLPEGKETLRNLNLKDNSIGNIRIKSHSDEKSTRLLWFFDGSLDESQLAFKKIGGPHLDFKDLYSEYDLKINYDSTQEILIAESVNEYGRFSIVKRPSDSEKNGFKGKISYSSDFAKNKTFSITLPKGLGLDSKKKKEIEEFIRNLFYQGGYSFKTFSCFFISSYDFRTDIGTIAIPLSESNQLNRNGSNIAKVLKNILKDEHKRKTFLNLVSVALPFIDDIKVDNYPPEHLILYAKEKYFSDFLSSNLLSTGTFNVIALILALYFDYQHITVIEEPDKGIHPSLIRTMVQMMKEASKEKQIIITTHNPEVVKHAGKENLLLVERDKEGFTNISRIKDKKMAKVFLKNIGIDELYINNLLEV